MATGNSNNHDRFHLDEGHPYPALHSFREEDRNYFFGREKEIKELAECIKNNVLTVVLGKSGIGKTSLLQAGLIPRLRNEYYLPIYIRIRFDDDKEPPIRQVKTIIESGIKKLDKTVVSFGDLTLWEYFYNLHIFEGHVKPLLFFDQFEEIFKAGKQNPKKVNPLVTEIGDLVQDWIPLSVQEKYKEQGIPYRGKKPVYRVIFSLREEYLPQLKNLARYMPAIVNGRYHSRLYRMKGEEALDAVLKPGHKIIARDTAVKILEKIPGSKDDDYLPYEEQNGTWKGKKIEPFLLSLFCYKINEKRLEKGLPGISQELLKEVSAEGITRNHYEENIRQVKNPRLRIAFEEELLTGDGQRKLQDISTLKSKFRVTDQDIERLVDKRIIRKETRNEVEYIELIHDVLAPTLIESRKERQAKAKKKKSSAIICIAVLMAVFFMLLAIYVDSQKNEAQKQALRARTNEQRARSNELAARSQMQSDKDPTLGFRLAEWAYRTDESNPNAYSALLGAFYSDSPFYRAVLRHEDNVNSAGFSPDGKYIVTAGKDKTAKLWDLKGNERQEFKHGDVVSSAYFSRDGQYIITTTADKEGKTLYHYWDFKGKLIKTGPGVNMNEISTPHRTTPDGKTLEIAKDSTMVRLKDSSGKLIDTLKGHTEEVLDAVFSPDGEYVLTAGYDDTARLWDITPVSSLKQEKRPAGLSYDFKNAVSPDKRFTVTVEWKNTLMLCDTAANRRWPMAGHKMIVNSAAFSPSGEYVVTASMDGTARLWDLKGNEKQVFKGHKESVNSACFSPDGRYIVTAGIDKTARLWLLNGAQVYEFKGFSESIKAAVFSIDGKYIIVTPESGPGLWRLVDAEEIIHTVDRAGAWKLDKETKKRRR